VPNNRDTRPAPALDLGFVDDVVKRLGAADEQAIPI
jgi:hypothetical protein